MILILAVIVLTLLYYYTTKNYDYWLKKGVKHDPPIPLFGNNLKNYIGLASLAEKSIELYNRYSNEKVVGFYRGPRPELLIRDPDIVRQVLTADFNYFHRRGLGRDPVKEPLFSNLFHVDGDRWKLLRQRLTPAFTTGKLKAMFPLIVECAERLQKVAANSAAKDTDCDVRDLMARFTTDFIGACGFGVQMDALNDENCVFRILGKRIFDLRLTTVLLIALKDLFPNFDKRLPPVSKKLKEDLTKIFTEVQSQRKGLPSGRNDFVDMLLELEKKGKIVGPSIERTNADGTPEQAELEMDEKIMVAQLFIFFAAGFETSSSATSFTLHQLAYNPDVQEKVYQEIKTVLEKYDNKLSYDAINEMTYLDMAFKEAMRMFPSLGTLHRVCARKYTIPELNLTLDPDVKILIPVAAIQNDEKYFENPKEFIPERFSPDNKLKHNYIYLPFGAGPRACVGERLGQMQSLAGLAAVLHKFQVTPGTTSLPVPKISHISNVVQSIKDGLPLRLVPRDC